MRGVDPLGTRRTVVEVKGDATVDVRDQDRVVETGEEEPCIQLI